MGLPYTSSKVNLSNIVNVKETNMFLRMMLSISFLSFAYGCGSGSSGGGGGPKGVREGGLGTPVSLALQDPNCQKNSSGLTLQGGPVNRSYTGEGVYQGMELKLLSKHVRFMIEAKDQSNISELRLCGNRDNVKSNTVEGATIQVLDDITAANEFFQRSRIDSKQTTQLSLNMFPMYEQYVKVEVDPDLVEPGNPSTIEQGGYITDNAAWTYSEDDSNNKVYSMIFFPKSKELAAKNWFNGKGLWEIPFVAKHEFGHHVFSEYMKYTPAFDAILSWYGNREKFQSMGTLSSYGSIANSLLLARMGESSQREVMWVAINEGFADLFAYLSMGGNDQLTDFACFSKNRQLSEAKFHDGRSKVMTRSVLDEFFTDSDSESIIGLLGLEEEDSCQSYSLADPHMIGAIIAHGILNILSDGDDIDELTIRTFKWMKSLSTSSSRYYNRSGSDLLSYVVSKAVDVVKAENPSINLDEKLGKYFPFMQGRNPGVIED